MLAIFTASIASINAGLAIGLHRAGKVSRKVMIAFIAISIIQTVSALLDYATPTF